ncbi:MAG: DUF547 domain-containing protein [Sedimentisphaerales bacterium]|nr:DUF547 domain-containing protein [Sedimentisphaerales bacterium]
MLAIAAIVLLYRRPDTVATNPVESVDYAHLDQLLTDCVDFQGRVNYRCLLENHSDTLKKQLDHFAAVDPDHLPRSRQRLAFWINAYNAICLQQVLDSGPNVKYVNQDGFFFTRKNYFIAGRKRSLNEIQNEIIRRNFNDPRIFSALMIPIKSGPPLRPEAYRPDLLNFQLDQQCRLWINNPAANRLDLQKNTLFLSCVFKNYAQDFDRLYDNPRGFYAKYTNSEQERSYVLNHPETSLIYLPFDWSLNGSF